MNVAPEFGASIRQNSPKHDYHQHEPSSHATDYSHFPGVPGSAGQSQQQQQQQDLTIDGIPNSFPHRRSRASRTFKNPPQPHMCIKEKTLDGKEVFINVLSWTRIANPDNPDAPIPLYGGMKVGKIPPGSPKVPPLVYAVMASPEVLKKAGRKCPDTPERMNLVDLMCEFVEAMNPSLHLSRKPEILKDRDLSGELKDVWSAVQACRDKCRSDNGPPENLVVYTEFGPDSAPSYDHTMQQQQQQQQQHFPQYQPNDYLLNEQQQQNRFPSLSSTAQHQPNSNITNHHSALLLQHSQQSAINNSNPSVTSIEPNSAISFSNLDSVDGGANSVTTSRPPVATGATVLFPSLSRDEDLARETEGLTIASSGAKTNGLSLPTEATVGCASAQISSATVPQTLTSPTAAPMPVTPAKEPKSSSGHTFFPMFRSSKSSSSASSTNAGNSVVNNNTNSAATAGGGHGASNSSTNSPSEKGTAAVTVNGGGVGESGASSPAIEAGEPTKVGAAVIVATAPPKPSSKKSGLNFFRRNKSGDKKEPSTPTKQPTPTSSVTVLPAAIAPAKAATPAATGAPSTTDTKLLLGDESAVGLGQRGSGGSHHSQHHQYHLEAGSNGGEIVESSATIVAK
ncbi:transcription factor mef2A [Anopheles bellator]|uniref:transcription factor mef2A n=1 Tax=Anopheles bellator TaxID=139047 RepID=UPI00264A3EE4|nr:transcription factor mef2A [Anopheles bellator]